MEYRAHTYHGIAHFLSRSRCQVQTCSGYTHRLHSSSFLRLPYRLLNTNHKKELLWGLWVIIEVYYVNVMWFASVCTDADSQELRAEEERCCIMFSSGTWVDTMKRSKLGRVEDCFRSASLPL